MKNEKVVVEAIDMRCYTGTDAIKDAGRTYRSMSEAFKDADYATAITRPVSELEDCINFLGGMLIISPAIGFALYIFYIVARALP
jgi:hypothetical protein